jgi:hypothetical protein
LRVWLRLYPAAHIMVADPGAILGSQRDGAGIRRLASFAGVSMDSDQIREELVQQASPGARQLGESSGVHENPRRYLLGKRSPPPEISRQLRDWLHPHNCDLAGLLLRQGLLYSTTEPTSTARGKYRDLLPWLIEELESSPGWADSGGPGGGICAGVVSVDQWFVGV